MSVRLSLLTGLLGLTVISSHSLAATSSERLTASSSLSPFTPPEILYYGANIGQFPPQVRHWIITEGFPVEKMERPWAREPNLKAWWSGDGNQVLFQASYTIAPGYVNEGQHVTWGEDAHYSGGSTPSSITNAKFRSLKARYHIKLHSEYLQLTDPAFAEVVNLAKQLSEQIEFDWASFDQYQGAQPIKTPGKHHTVCSGYSDIVMDRVVTLESVASVEEWAGGNHRWNVVNLKDGRKLYLDLTWFDNEYIDHDSGLIVQKADYQWGNITFDQAVFNYANLGYGSAGLVHTQGRLISKVTKRALD